MSTPPWGRGPGGTGPQDTPPPDGPHGPAPVNGPQDDPGDDQPTVKEEAAKAAVDITKGAIAGNLAGAAAAAAKTALKSRQGRKLLIVAGLIGMIPSLLPMLIPMLLLGSVIGGTSGNQQGASAEVVLEAGLTQEEIDVAQRVGKERGVSWLVLDALLLAGKSQSTGKGPYHITDEEISGEEAEDLESATEWVAKAAEEVMEDQPDYSPTTDIGIGGQIDSSGVIEWVDQAANDKYVITPYTAGLAELPLAGMTETWAGQIIKLAVGWRFGVAGTLSACTTGPYTGGLPTNLSFEIDAEQMANAVIIVHTGQGLSIPETGLVIALMTAIQESSLRNLDYGDRDSLGLFQQRPSTGWGTPEEIMDPVKSSSAFYGLAAHTDNPGVVDIDGWETMPLGEVAQAVQRSAFPDAYDKWEGDARLLVAWITGTGGRHYDIGPVQPETQYLADFLGNMFGIETIYGWRESDPYPDHPSGIAADFMVYEDRALGDRLAQYAMEHAAELKIKYILWYQRSWTAGDPVGDWKPMEDRGGDTANHKDHVHITVNAAGATPTSSESTSGSGSSTTYDGPHVDIGEVQPLTQYLADVIADEFDVTSLSGNRPDPVFPDHPGGVGVDFIVGDDDAKGEQIVAYAQEHAAELKVTYVLWKGGIWHIDDPIGAWVPYLQNDPMHADSVHITATEATLATACGGTTPPPGGDWVNPLPAGSYALTSPFGWRIHPVTGIRTFHAGQDMGTGDTTPPIVSVAAGTVTFAGDCGCGYGNLTTIDVGGGMVIYYGHQSAISTTVGAIVAAGDPIGTVGTTGTSTGNHLHLEIRLDGKPVDPIPILAEHGVTL